MAKAPLVYSDRGTDMARAYKKQHWLPVSYLKFFSASGKDEGRDTPIFVCGPDGCRKQAVDKVAVGTFLYSKMDPEAAEKSFSSVEGDYPPLVRKAAGGGELTDRERFNLLIVAVSLSARNPSYENRTGRERVRAAEMLFEQLLLWLADDDLEEFTRVWKLSVLAAESPLVTSDHPAVLFRVGRPAFGILPITPSHVACFYDSRVATVGSIARDEDVLLLNRLQFKHSMRFVYASFDLTGEVSADPSIVNDAATPFFSGRAESSSVLLNAIKYPFPDQQLSFVQIR